MNLRENQPFLRYFNLRLTPTSIIIGKDAQISFQKVGLMSIDELKLELDKVLE